MHALSQYGSPEPNLLRLNRGPPTQYSLHGGSISGAHRWMTWASAPNLLSYQVAGTRCSPFTHAGFHLVGSQLIGLTPPTCTHSLELAVLSLSVSVSCHTFALLLLVGRLGTMPPISAIASLPSLPTGGTPSTGARMSPPAHRPQSHQ